MPFLSKMVYKRVRGWTSEWSLPLQNVSEQRPSPSPFPPQAEHSTHTFFVVFMRRICKSFKFVTLWTFCELKCRKEPRLLYTSTGVSYRKVLNVATSSDTISQVYNKSRKKRPPEIMTLLKVATWEVFSLLARNNRNYRYDKLYQTDPRNIFNDSMIFDTPLI